ncbi:MAG: aminotransferase class I/II-fold pyridoxal phosphate-dependent enzyme [Bacteroidetes bacterium]|nr:aminotransferase class I/II-fold pyridoxal phosphate-dependent enzyme [Bacteroidota bacterium]
MENRLKDTYNPGNFNSIGHELIDLLTKYLKDSTEGNIPVMNWKEPSDQLKFWKDFTLENNNPIELFKAIIDNSIHIHHPKYMGHQLCPPAPISALTGLLGELINNGMAIYEMGAAATAIEKVIIDLLAKKIGYDDNGDGYITSGGTIGNLTAMLAARQNAVDSDIWEDGLTENLGVMVSSEAHYSVDRALRIMGFGSKGIIKIPVGDNFSIRTELLDQYYKQAEKNGVKVIAVVGCAPSTSTGMYDDLVAIGNFCKQKELWFHVDGAHGGGAIFSKKYKHLLSGIEKADSVVIDGHKMLMTPALLTFVMFRQKEVSYSTFSQKAQYLWEKNQDEEWFNMARRTIECTKLMMSIKFYSILITQGEEVFDQSVTHLYDLGKEFAKKIKERDNFELALEPDSNIVCFRFIKPGVTGVDVDNLNSKIRSKLLKDGEFYIVQTILNDRVYLRTTLINPFTNSQILDELLDEIERLGGN